ERAQEGRCGEPGIGAEPDAGNEGPEPVQDGEYEIEASRCRVGIASAELTAEKVAAIDAGDHGVEAASVVVRVVRGAGLMAVDFVRDGIEVDRDLQAAVLQYGPYNSPND